MKRVLLLLIVLCAAAGPLEWQVVRSGGREAPADIRSTLLELYNSTNGPSWHNNTGWGSAGDWCSWYGVDCDGGRHVCPIALKLNGNNLDGPLPDSLRTLSDLNALLLYDNSITGTIPKIGILSDLQVLWLSNNKMEGAVPVGLSYLKIMQYLFLSQNNFDGIDAKKAPGEGKLKSTTCDFSANKFKCPIPAWSKQECKATCS